MNKICIIICYFGKLPSYFEFWRHSAYNNPTINFLFITDCNIESANNIRVLKMSFFECKNYIQQKFDFEITIDSPYKLCDFKGSYGYIFQDYIREYDFWGFGDIDLIYGNIRLFLTNDILDAYDMISGWGHFTLYRNNTYCNNFFLQKVDEFLYYKDVFQSHSNMVFDEYLHKGLSDRWMHLNPQKVYKIDGLFDDVLVPHRAMHFKAWGYPYKKLIYHYCDGTLYRVYILKGKVERKACLYAHFQQRKNFSIHTNKFDSYVIIPNSFIPFKTLSVWRVRFWGRKRYISFVIYRIKTKLMNIFKNIK